MDGIPDFSQFTENKPLEYNENGFVWGFSTKKDGDARTPDMILKLQQRLNVQPKSTVKLGQIHGTEIKIVDTTKEKDLVLNDTDGVIATVPGVFLSVVTADCVPVLYIDKKTGIIGASHQGWKGSLDRMAIKMVEKMTEVGADKSSIEAFIGPSIGVCCYNVEKDRFLKFKEEFYSYHHLFTKVEGDKQFLNLSELNVQQLLEAGLGWGNVTNLSKCTSCNKDEFYSYRRDSEEQFGEMAGYVLHQ